MLKTTFLSAAVLIALGVGFYLGTGMGHITSLFPAFVGGLLVLLGLAALAPALRKHMIHLALGLSLLLGVMSLGMGVPGLITRITEGEHPRGVAPVLQTLMGVVLLGYVGLGVRSFLAARRARKSAGQGESAEASPA